MSRKRGPKKAATAVPPRIHEATLGPHGVVYRGASILVAQAIQKRTAGQDVVVCGAVTRDNRLMAKTIEDAVGPNIHHDAHLGGDSLPHYQPISRPPEGHCFYERVHAKSKRLP